MTAVWLSVAVKRVFRNHLYSPLEGVRSPRSGIVKDTVQRRIGSLNLTISV